MLFNYDTKELMVSILLARHHEDLVNFLSAKVELRIQYHENCTY